MSTRTIIINALRAFELHTEVDSFTRRRILKSKERCFTRITGLPYVRNFVSRLAGSRGLAVAGIAGLLLAAGVTLVVIFKGPDAGGPAAMQPAYVTFHTGSVTIERAGAPVSLAVKTAIHDGDLVRVAEKSCLVMQTADGQVTRFEAGTEAVVTSVADARARSVSLRKGRVLSLVKKLSRDEQYEIRTPNALAAVRGTMFLTEFNGKESVVAVSEGRVSVEGATAQDAAPVIVEQGTSAVRAVAAADTVTRPSSAVEKLELSKLAITPVVEDIGERTPAEIDAVFTDKQLRETEEKINSSIEDESGLSFERMSEKYGRIDILTLYTGRVLRGVIVSRGKQFKVLTAAGPVLVNAEDIQNTETINK